MLTPDWPMVKAWADEKLADKRKEIESLVLTHEKTLVLRGQIILLKQLLELPASDENKEDGPLFESVKY